MLTRRALIASSAALAAGCGPFGSSSSFPSLSEPTALTWYVFRFARLVRTGQYAQDQQDTISRIVVALEEDEENPNGPARGGYTLTGHAQEYPGPRSELRSIEDYAKWIGGMDTDILAVDAWLARGLGEQGVLLPLDRLLAAEKQPFTDTFYPYVLEHFQRSGGLFALPVSAEPLMLHYDARYFAQQDVPPVDESWDWDDLVENAKKLTWRSEDGKLTRWGLMSHMYGLWWALWQNKAEMFDPATARCRLRESAAVEALRFCYDLLHTHQVSPPRGAVDLVENFRPPSGNWPAMSYIPYQSWWWPGYRWADLPQGRVRSVPVRADLGLAIHTQTKHTEAAYTALKGLLHVLQRFVPVPAQRESVAKLGEIQPSLPPDEVAALQRSMEHGHPLPNNYIGPTMYQIVDDLAYGANVATVVNNACSFLQEHS